MRMTHIFSTGLLAFATVAGAQPSPNTTRILPLAECIQLALKHNLSVQIERFNPTLSLYALDLAYAPYDATFNMSVVHTYSTSPGGSGNFGVFGSSESGADNFVPSLSGLLPSGMTYKIDNNFVSQQGTFVSSASRYTGNGTLTLTQPLLRNSWIDSTRLNIQISKKDLKISHLVLHLRKGRSDFRAALDVAAIGARLATGGADLRYHAGRIVGACGETGDAGTFSGEFEGDGLAETAAGAGHDREFVGELADGRGSPRMQWSGVIQAVVAMARERSSSAAANAPMIAMSANRMK